MPVNTTAHLNFHGQAREALEFYQSVFGGQTVLATYGDFGMPRDLPGADRVVFGQVTADNGFRVMAYDVPGGAAETAPATHAGTAAEHSPATSTRREHGMTLTTEPFFLSVRGDAVAEVEVLWHRLSAGAAIIEQFGPAAWAPAFGMLTDRFGVTWILDVASG